MRTKKIPGYLPIVIQDGRDDFHAKNQRDLIEGGRSDTCFRFHDGAPFWRLVLNILEIVTVLGYPMGVRLVSRL